MTRSKIVFPHIQHMPHYTQWLGAILAKGEKNRRKFLRVEKAVLDRECEYQARRKWPNDSKLLEEILKQMSEPNNAGVHGLTGRI